MHISLTKGCIVGRLYDVGIATDILNKTLLCCQQHNVLFNGDISVYSIR